MKLASYIIVVMLLASAVTAQSTEQYYWYNGEKQPLQLKTDKWFLLFDEKPELQTLH